MFSPFKDFFIFVSFESHDLFGELEDRFSNIEFILKFSALHECTILIGLFRNEKMEVAAG